MAADIYILRDLSKFQSVSDAIEAQGLKFEYRILNQEVIESNRYISRMLGIPLATKVLRLRKLRVIEGTPKSIEQTYIRYDRIKGMEHVDVENQSFYRVLRERYGYVTQKSEEEILIVNASEEERRLLQSSDREFVMIKGNTYIEDPEPFEYFEIVSVSDFYVFRSVSR